MPLLALPNELLLKIAEEFDYPDLNSFLLVNRRTAFLFAQLLERLAIKPKDNLSALQWAASRGYYPLAKLAISAGLDVDERCQDLGRTPLHFAIARSADDMVRLLLDHGANPNVRTKSGSTPLHWAAMCGMEEACSLLISAGAETAWKNGDGMTPLHCAVEGGADAFARVLSEVGISECEEMDTSGVTVTKEEYYRRRRVVRIVLDHTMRLDAQEVNGNTALHYAAREGRRKVVGWLLEKGADAYVKDRTRSTPLDVARVMGHRKVEELLEEHYRQNKEPLWRVFLNNVMDIIKVGA